MLRRMLKSIKFRITAGIRSIFFVIIGLSRIALKKGVHELFEQILHKIGSKTDFIFETMRKWKNPQIQQGKRAISKKLGHAKSEGFVSAFEGTQINQKSAEKILNDIIKNADAIVIRPKRTKIYLPNGQGLSINTKDGTFIGFVERIKETGL